MWLGYFTDEAYIKLRNGIKENTNKYLSDDDWLPAFFRDLDPYYKESRAVDVDEFIPSYEPNGIKKTDAQKSEEDLVNVRLMYDSFKKLSPLQASNKYMWTYLCHANPKYRAYIKDRFLGDMRDDTILTRFFVTSSGTLKNDNALSRLWWYGYLTYDKDNSANPYALTKILLTNQTIATDVLDTFNSRNPNRMKGVLWGIRDFCEEIQTTSGITVLFRECKKYLNHYGAVTTLDFLEPEEIRDLTFNYMLKLRDQGFKRKPKK